MASTAPRSISEAKRVGKFGIVGVLNTAIDFTILNLAHFRFGLALIPANIISTTCAMIFSFFANRQVVFKPEGGDVRRQVVLFFVTTAFGLYVIQNGIIWLLTGHWLSATQTLAVNAVHDLGLARLSSGFIVANAAKVVGTIASLVWNYIIYKRVVFK